MGKHLKQEVNEDLRVCVNERSPCGLSITGDIINVTSSKGNDITTLNREVPCELLSRNCFYCPNLITVAPVTRDKEICQSYVNIR